ncbi:uncharacterized protein LOC131945132 [Physella acuta]|uniref:uncharacterized protein LOC131945132 n=1 Tax=Physella acuta TaxID=109671 RepID=UPI0027DDF302|nr:uncharacterized protein LOC131945132 [Physella acuta]
MGEQPRTEAALPDMTSLDESRKEVSTLKQSLVTPKIITRIGAWNVRTMYETSKTAQVVKEMSRYRINILGISEMRWTDSGLTTLGSGETIIYSGRSDNQHQEGVGIIMDKISRKSLIGWEPINSRMLRARFYSRHVKITVIQCYAPTEQAKDEDKDMFYHTLQDQIDRTPQHDILVVMGDMNAKIGASNEGYEICMGKEGLGEANNNGQRFREICLENGLVIGGSLFQHKEIHKSTWISPDKRTSNQIDHIAINKKWRRSMRDVKAIRGADVGSDHNLVLCKLQLKLKRVDRKVNHQLFDSAKLKDPTIKANFAIELKNRFSLLENLPEEDTNTQCEKILDVNTKTSQCILGHRNKQRKEWISNDTWNLIEKRREAKIKTLSGTMESRVRNDVEYRRLQQEVKRNARKDKRNYVDTMATEAQAAADKGDSRTVYKIIRTLTGGIANRSSTIKDKNGKVLTTEKHQLKRWAEYFEETLNRPDPEEAADFTDMNIHFEMYRGPILEQEIIEAIQKTKKQ